MLSFTKRIKRELLKKGLSPDEKSALIAGYLASSAKKTKDKLLVVSEDERVLEYVLRLIEDTSGVELRFSDGKTEFFRESIRLTFECSDDDAEKVKELFSSGELELLSDAYDDLRALVLRGVFLGGGSCTTPSSGSKTGYHLEFVLPDEETEGLISNVFASFDLIPRSIERGEKRVVYFNSIGEISDFFSVIGSEVGLESLSEISIQREENNHFNRQNNCYTGNLDRTASACAEQIVMIGEIDRIMGLDNLEPALKELAEARLKNREASMRALGENLGITKSCLNHRMRKLAEIYKSLVK